MPVDKIHDPSIQVENPHKEKTEAKPLEKQLSTNKTSRQARRSHHTDGANADISHLSEQ